MKQPVVTIGNAFSAGKELPFRPFAWCIILDYMHYGLPDAKISTVDWYVSLPDATTENLLLANQLRRL